MRGARGDDDAIEGCGRGEPRRAVPTVELDTFDIEMGEPLLRIVRALGSEGVARQLADTTLYGLLVGGLICAALMAVEGVAVRP